MDERLGLEQIIAEHLSDSHQGLNTQFTLADLLRQSVYSRLAGYEDLNDPARLSADPTFDLDVDPAGGLGSLKNMRRKNLAVADVRGCITVRMLDAKMEIPV